MIEKSFQTPLPLELEVRIPAGQIDVETVDGQESSVVVDGNEDLLDDVEIRHSGGRLVVGLRGKSKLGFVVAFGSRVFGNAGLRVQARIPHGASLTVKTSSADLGADGQFRSLDVNSVSGDVHLRGPVEHDASVKTVSGDLELQRVGGNASVQSVSGDLRLGPVGGSVETKSVSGDIRLASLSRGQARFTSVSGDIEVGIAAGSVLDVDAETTSGDLSSEVPLASDSPSEGGDSDPTVVLRGRTVSGDLRVFRAG